MPPDHVDLSQLHRPVLVEEVIRHLAAPERPPALIVDGTVGLGGHAEAMLSAWPASRLLGLDRDPHALQLCKERLKKFGLRVRLFHASYEDLAEVLELAHETKPDAVLLDLGVSSMQLDTPQRGFSFKAENVPADMRFDPAGGGPTAMDLVNRLPEEALAKILFEHGGERHARDVARALVAARPLRSIGGIRSAIRTVVRRDASGIDPATRSFQGLRIAVNDERGHLERGLKVAFERTASGGRIAVIAFHSGEEHAVKEAFRAAEVTGKARVLTAKPIRPTEHEARSNPRAKSSRLRVAELAAAVEVVEPAKAARAAKRKGGSRK